MAGRVNRKTLPPPAFGVERQASAVRLDDGAADRKADAQSGFLGRVERIENALGIVRRDSGAGVRDAHRDLTVAISCYPDLDRSGVPALRPSPRWRCGSGSAPPAESGFCRQTPAAGPAQSRIPAGCRRCGSPVSTSFSVSATNGPTSTLARSESCFFTIARSECSTSPAREACSSILSSNSSTLGIGRAGPRAAAAPRMHSS